VEPPPPDPPPPPGVRRPSILTPHQAASSEAFGALDWGVFLAVSGIWGASFLFIAEGLEVFEPGLVTWLRVSLGAATLMALPAARHRVAVEDRAALVALSILWVALPFTLFPFAQTHISSAVAGMLNGATPLFTVLVGAAILRSMPGRSQAVGLAVGLAGVVTISVAQSGVGESAWQGIAMVVGATACYGFAIHIAGPLQARYGSVVVMGRMLLLASVWTAPLGLAGIPGSDLQVSSVLAVVTLGTLGTGVAFALMATLVGRVGGTRASFITYVVPVVALGLGIVLRGDDVRPWAIGGVALVIAGAFLASRREGPAAALRRGALGPGRD
jgi:drug/metabolite transporter (DMT)-like permease